MATILFPARPGTKEVDSSFQAEFDAALRAGFSSALVDGGSAGLPDPEDAAEFYRALAAAR